MDSSVTVADARTAFARFQLSNAEFLRKLNRASEYFLGSEVYTDLFSVLRAVATTGYLTPPRGYGRVYGAQQDENLAPGIYGQWTEFVEAGIARQDPATMRLTGLVDMGNKFVTQHEVWNADVESEGTLRVKIANPVDSAKAIRFYGTFTDTDLVERDVLDVAGVPGLNLTTVNPSADTSQLFKKVTGIQAPVMVGRWTLWKVVSGVETQIGAYEPGETRPRYFRYKTGAIGSTFHLYCKRQFVTYVNDTDWIYPDNVNAYEHAFAALDYRDRSDHKAEAERWKLGKDVLKEFYANAVPPIRQFMTSDGFGYPGPNVRATSGFGMGGGY